MIKNKGLLFQFVLPPEHHRGRYTASIPHDQADSGDQPVCPLVRMSLLSARDYLMLTIDQVCDGAPGVRHQLPGHHDRLELRGRVPGLLQPLLHRVPSPGQLGGPGPAGPLQPGQRPLHQGHHTREKHLEKADTSGAT